MVKIIKDIVESAAWEQITISLSNSADIILNYSNYEYYDMDVLYYYGDYTENIITKLILLEFDGDLLKGLYLLKLFNTALSYIDRKEKLHALPPEEIEIIDITKRLIKDHNLEKKKITTFKVKDVARELFLASDHIGISADVYGKNISFGIVWEGKEKLFKEDIKSSIDNIIWKELTNQIVYMVNIIEFLEKYIDIEMIARWVGESSSLNSWIKNLKISGYPISDALIEGSVLLSRISDTLSYMTGITLTTEEEYNATRRFIKETPLKEFLKGMEQDFDENLEVHMQILRTFLEKVAIS